jgi:hypothetical protein
VPQVGLQGAGVVSGGANAKVAPEVGRQTSFLAAIRGAPIGHVARACHRRSKQDTAMAICLPHFVVNNAGFSFDGLLRD